MKKTSLVLAIGLIVGPTFAQAPTPQPSVSTAPTPAAPSGVTTV